MAGQDQDGTRPKASDSKRKGFPVAISGNSKAFIAGGGLVVAAALLMLQRLVFRRPCSRCKPTATCVPLADGSECVVRREIAGDNSCLFNAVGYGMHKVRTRAAHLRSVVAQVVASDPEQYTKDFLDMGNDEYCAWIRQSHNWGGGIELSILAKGYSKEITAWSIESAQPLVFGEESGEPADRERDRRPAALPPKSERGVARAAGHHLLPEQPLPSYRPPAFRRRHTVLTTLGAHLSLEVTTASFREAPRRVLAFHSQPDRHRCPPPAASSHGSDMIEAASLDHRSPAAG
ncbi:MAG: hypothetical protein WDW38_008954 [Sanguina aurantia]